MQGPGRSPRSANRSHALIRLDFRRHQNGSALRLQGNELRVGLGTISVRGRHLVEAPRDCHARKLDRSLLRLFARAHRFRDPILRCDGKSIAVLAEENGVGRHSFSGIVRLGFSAPDITAAILEGRQPIELSAERMPITADSARDWSEQRRELGFG